MSYAQQHRNRRELHYSSLGYAPTDVSPLPAPSRTSADAALSSYQQQQLQRQQSSHRSVTDGGKPPRSTSSLLRANHGQLQQNHATGIDIAAWSEAASSANVAAAAAGERQPFKLLLNTPPRNNPPHSKASRKQFASPRASATPSEADHSATRVSRPLVLDSAPPEHAEATPRDSYATELRGDHQQSQAEPQPPQPQEVTQEAVDEEKKAEQPSASEARAATPAADEPLPGGVSPSPIPVSHQESLPQPMSSGQPQSVPPQQPQVTASEPSPVSEAFTARLRNIMDTRQQIEALVQKQREDEEEMAQAIAKLDEYPQSQPSPRPQTSPSSATAELKPALTSAAASGAAAVVDRRAYEQVLMERTAAFVALREFKEKGNAIVHRLYDTVKSQQEQSVELMATIEALKKANKRLKDNNSSYPVLDGAPRDSAADSNETVAELQQKVATQHRVIEQMDQLMQNADRMLLMMRARVEAAERRAAAATAAATADRRQLPPLPKGAQRPPAGFSSGSLAATAASMATPEAVGAIERLCERYAYDPDVATVAAQQQLLLERIAQLRQSLKEEEAQRLHLEEVYGATSEETARNVALLEARLQRAQNPRGAPHGSGNTDATSDSALRHELNTLAEVAAAAAEDDDDEEEERERRDVAEAESKEKNEAVYDAAPLARHQQQRPEMRQQEPTPAPEHVREEEEQQPPHTPSHASSCLASRSSTPTRTLFTALSVDDAGTATTANNTAHSHKHRKQPSTHADAPKPSNATEKDAHVIAAPSAQPEVEEKLQSDAAPVNLSSPPCATTTSPVAPHEDDIKKGAEAPSPSIAAPPPPADMISPARPEQPQSLQNPRQPRAYLRRRRSAETPSTVAAVPVKQSLGIPMPDTANLGSSLRRSFNSRSSSGSHRLVDFRPALTADATSRGLESMMSDLDDEDDVITAADAEVPPNTSKAGTATAASADAQRASTVTPTAIHSSSSPLPDTTTSAERSIQRQQRLREQMWELDQFEADVTNVSRSLNVDGP